MLAVLRNPTKPAAYLHIASTRCFGTSSGDVLADVAGRDDDLGFADIVVFQEDDLEQVSNIFVRVDDPADLVDQMDDGLCHPVSGRRLSTEDVDTRLDLLAIFRRHVLDLEIAMNDAENVQLLPLVLVHTLDLNVE